MAFVCNINKNVQFPEVLDAINKALLLGAPRMMHLKPRLCMPNLY